MESWEKSSGENTISKLLSKALVLSQTDKATDTLLRIYMISYLVYTPSSPVFVTT